MDKKIYRQKKILTIPPEELVLDATWYIYWDVLACLQDLGVTIISLENGNPIFGQVSIFELGMVGPNTPLIPKRKLGFPTKSHPGDKPEYEKQKIEAVIIMDPDDQSPDKSFLLFVKIVDVDNLQDWKDLLEIVTGRFMKRVRGIPQPRVVFNVSALSQGHPSAHAAVLNRIQKSIPSTNAGMSFTMVQPDESFYDEEDEEGTEDPS